MATFTLTPGLDELTGGTANDIFIVGSVANYGADDFLDGGPGNDTINFTSLTPGTLNLEDRVDDVEAITLTGTASLHLDADELLDPLVITGNAGANSIRASQGSDTITGGAGADSLIGGAGNDRFLLGALADYAAGEVIDGGAGTDTLIYTGTAAATLVLTANTTSLEAILIGSAAGLTTGTAAVNINASALAGAVAMTGNAGANALTGTAFSDTLTGGGGNDNLQGGDGNDLFLFAAPADLTAGEQVIGGAGIDVLRFASATAGQTLVLTANVTGVETVEIAGATALNINAALVTSALSITGNSAANVLTGTAQNDTLAGGAGNDSFLIASSLQHGAGEAILGGEGTDTILFTSTTAGQTLALSAQVQQVENIVIGTAAGVTTGTTPLSVDASNVGSSLRLTGNAGSNLLAGGAGDDTLVGGLGNDSLLGNAGNDVFLVASVAELGATEAIDGGADYDALRITGTVAGNYALTASTVNLEAVVISDVAGDDSGTVKINVSAEAVAGSLSIVGNSGANKLVGTAQADTLTGGAGADSLSGGGGNDVFVVESELDFDGDSVSGGSGADSLRFASQTAGETLTLTTLNGVENVAISDAAGFSGGTTALNINASAVRGIGMTLSGNDGDNNIAGTRAPDTVTGNGGSDWLSGSGGNDLLIGGAERDFLFGGSGDDTLRGGEGADAQSGGAGFDVFEIAANAEVVAGERIDGGSHIDTVRLTGSGLLLDLDAVDLSSIEIVDLTGSGDNRLALTAADVLGINFGATLRVDGNAGDRIASSDDWTQGLDTIIGANTYARYTLNGATLLVDTDIARLGLLTSVPPGGSDKTLTIAEDGNHAFSAGDFGFSDANAGDALQAVRIDALPSAGSLTLSGVAVAAGNVIAVANLGNLVFAPAADANGTGYANFTFSVQDSEGFFDPSPNAININVAAVNDAPSLTSNGGGATASVSVSENSTGVSTATASDPDSGTVFTYSIAGGTDATFFAIDPASGNLSFHSAPDFESPADAGGNNVYDVTVRVSDGTLIDVQAVAVTVTDVNDAPILDAVGDRAVNEGTTLNFVVTASDADTPADTLTFSLAGAPAGATIHAETGLFLWTPGETQGPGSYTFEVVVADDGALSDSETITVVVNEVNRAPVLSSIGSHAVNEGAELSFTASATDADTPANGLTFSLDQGAPAGAAIDPDSGVFTWTPDEAQGPGNYLFTVRVTDDASPARSDFETIAVAVNEVNLAPVLDAIGDQTANEGRLLTFAVSASDADEPFSGLSFSLVGAPEGATINAETGLFSWTPTGDQGGAHVFEIVATDGSTPSLSDSESITVTVGVGPSLAISDAVVVEGDEGGSQLALFTVTLFAPVEGETVAVAYITEDGSAFAGDYESIPVELAGALVFNAGVTMQTIAIPVTGDFDPEGDEIFFVNLFAPTNAVLADAQGMATILSEEPPPPPEVPQVGILGVTLFEGNSGTHFAQFTVGALDAVDGEWQVAWSTADGTASAGSDYTAASGVLTFLPGEQAQVIQIEVNGDTLQEADEGFFVNLAAVQGSEIVLEVDQAAATILDDDHPASLSISDAQVIEGNITLEDFAQGIMEQFSSPEEMQAFQNYLAGFPPEERVQAALGFFSDFGLQVMQFTVNLSGAVSGPVSVDFSTVNGSALGVAWDPSNPLELFFPPPADPDQDYINASGTLTFTATQRSAQIFVLLNPDGVVEPDETFSVVLSNASGAAIVDGEGVGTILTDDGIRVFDTQVREEDGAAQFTVALSSPSTVTVTVDYATADGSATSGSDYTAVSGTLTFAPGETEKTIAVPILTDASFEGLEEFSVVLSNASGAPLVAGGIATGQISDFPTLSVAPASLAEGDSGTSEMLFTVTLSSALDQDLELFYSAQGNTAQQGLDFEEASGSITLPAGQTSVQIAVQVNGDTTFELDKTLELQVSGEIPDDPDQLLASATGTIVNDDPGTLISINDVSVVEGSGGSTFAVFTVTLSGTPLDESLSVFYSTQDGDASFKGDYQQVNGFLEFLPGETEKTIEVQVSGDFEPEPDEQFYVTLGDPGLPDVLLAKSFGVGTIEDDDTPLPQVSISGASVLEGDAGLHGIQFQVHLDGQNDSGFEVTFSTADGSALAGLDYVAQSGTLSFAPGEYDKTIEIQVSGDQLEESDENFFVNLVPQEGDEASAQGLILDDDGPARLAIGDVTVEEGGFGWDPDSPPEVQVATFTVSRRGDLSGSVTVDYSTADGSATGGDIAQAGFDYAAASGTLTFAPGEFEKTIEVLIRPDFTLESDESFFVNLTNAAGATITDSQGQGLITNDDDPASLETLDAATVSDDLGTNAVFTVTLSAPQDVTVTVDYATSNGSATAGSDYTAASGTLSFAPGETEKTLQVAVTGDAEFEGEENFLLTLGSAEGAQVMDGEATSTINDLPTISAGDVNVAEGNDGDTHTALFTVTLSKAITATVTVDYATSDGSATAGADYSAVSGTLTFAPGETTKTVSVDLVGDSQFEFDEQFQLQFANAVNAVLPTTATATIANDDSGYVLSIGDATVLEDSELAVFTVTLTTVGTPAEDTVSVFYQTQEGSASAFNDYQPTGDLLQFFPGETTKTIAVQINGDGEVEGDEQFFVNLFAPTNALIADGQGVGTILNDDVPPPPAIPQVGILGVTLFEGNSGTHFAQFTVGALDAVDGEWQVAWSTADGTASAGSDYTAASGVLTFLPGEQAQVIQIEVNGDTLQEADEGFFVNLAAVQGSEIVLEVDQAAATILDDDHPASLSISDAQVIEGNITLEDFAQGIMEQFSSPEEMQAFQNYLAGFPPEERVQAALGFFSDFGLQVMQFTVNLSGAVSGPVSVDFSTVNGSALGVAWDPSNPLELFFPPPADPDQDYINASGTLTFTATQRSAQIFVLLNPDGVVEPDETFSVVLSNASGAAIVDGEGVGTILTDDGIRVFDTQVREEDGAAQFTVALSSPSTVTVTVDYATADGSATSGSDYTAVSGTLTFAPGETEKTIAVPILTDASFEGLEEFSVVLSNASGAPLVAGGIATGQISDFPTLSVAPASLAEGDSGTSEMLFTVTLSSALDQDLELFYSAQGNTAQQGLDFEEASGSITLPAGQTSVQIAVQVNGDTTFELDKTLELQVSGEIPDDPDQLLASATGTIVNDDPGTLISINDVSVVEGSGGSTFAVFTVTLSGTPLDESLSVFYSTQDGDASFKGDYQQVNGFLEFLPGETEKTIEVQVSGDFEPEPDEQFYVTLGDPGLPDVLLAKSFGVGTIEDDDTPLPQVSISGASVLEGDAGLHGIQFQVHLDGQNDSGFEVTFSTADGSALAGLDYVAQSGTLSFAPGEYDKTIEIQVSGDQLEESDENFFVNLVPQEGDEASAQGLILDDDGPARLAIGDVTVEEGGFGWDPDSPPEVQVATFTVSRRGDLSGSVTVDYSTADGSATGGDIAQAGFDYAAASGTLTFAPGEFEKTIEVLIRPDFTLESDESFFVNLTNAAGATITDSQGQGLITNDDDPASLETLDAATVSDDLGTNAVFTVTLSAPQDVTVTVDYATSNGSATAGSDYTAASGTLSFAPGETEKTLQVAVTGDAEFEGEENFLLTLGSAEGAQVMDGEATSTINDLPTISAGDVNVAEGNDGDTHTALFTVTLSKAITATVTVDYATSDGSATAGADYSAVSGTLTFAPGETTKTVSVDLVGDSQFEFDEQFQLQFANAVNAVLPTTATATIANDDSGYVLSIGDATVLEDSELAVFTVTLTTVGTPAEDTVSVFYQTQEGSASAFNDYQPTGDLLQFFPGETTKTIAVQINGDGEVEGDEQFFVNLFAPTNALIADGQGVGTILNDDVPPPPAIPQVGILGVTLFEGNSGTHFAQFTVGALDAVDGEWQVAWSTADGTASAGSDYTAASGVLTFLPGEQAQVIQIEVNGDTLQEADEGFFVNLAAVQGSEIVLEVDQAAATILDDDHPASLSISDAQVIEGNITLEDFAQGIMEQFSSPEEMQAFQNYLAGFPPEERVQAALGFFSDFGLQVMQFTVNLSGAVSGPVSVDFSTVNGSALGVAWDPSNPLELFFPPPADPDQDYINASGTLTFTATQRSAQIFVLLNPDGVVEPDETFSVVLSNASGAAIVDGEGVGTILTDDGIRVFDTQVREEDGAAQFTVALSSPSTVTVTVDYATADGSATSGSDYTAVSGTLTFAPGETEKTIAVPILTDASFEGLEEFSVVLSNASGAPLVAGGIATGQISDFPTLSVAPASLAEGDSGTSEMLFTVTLSSALDQDLELFYSTYGKPADAGIDFEEASGSITLPAGQTSLQIAVQVNGDTDFELDESFGLQVTGTIPDDSDELFAFANGTIVNDDTGIIVDSVSVVEGNEGSSVAVFTVTLSQAESAEVTVQYFTEDQSALAGSDYTAVSGTLSFAPGETVATIEVPISGDTDFEPDETFLLHLTNPVNAGMLDGETIVSGTILGDDLAISINDTTVIEGNAGYRAAVFTVNLLGPASDTTVSVHFSTADGSATAGEDYVAIAGTISFEPGETVKQFTIPVKGDFATEFDETFGIVLSNPVGAGILDGDATAVVFDNDPGFWIDDVEIAEWMQQATFTVTRTGPTQDAATVDISTVSAGAESGLDFYSTTDTLTFEQGETVKTFNVQVNDDSLYEADETFIARLSNAQGATIGKADGTATILDDESPPQVFFNPETVFVDEGDGGTTEVVFTVHLSGASGLPVDVDFSTANGTAGSADYVAATGTLHFAPGEVEQSISVSVVGDAFFEQPIEIFSVSLSNPVNADLFSGDTAEAWIYDDDLQPTLGIGDAAATDGFGATSAVFTVTLSAPRDVTVTVDYVSFDGSATSGSDYTAVSGTLAFAPGETEKTIDVPVTGDADIEGTELFFVLLSNAAGAGIMAGGGGGIGIITELPAVSVTDASVAEGDAGTAQMSFTVSLSGAVPGTVTVDYSTFDSSATAGSDYTAVSGTLTFAPGETEKMVSVDIAGDTDFEGDETLFVELDAPANATLGDFAGIGTILDDDAVLSILDAAPVGDNGGTSAFFTVTRSGLLDDTVTVDFATSDDSAIAGSDYTAVSGTLTFAPGETTKMIEVAVTADAEFEGLENFTVTLSNPQNAGVLDGEATGTISDLPTISIGDSSVAEGDAGTLQMSFTVSLSGAVPGTVTVDYATATDGSATAGSDYTAVSGTLTFAPGETEKTVSVDILGDTTYEGDEQFHVDLTAPTNATLENVNSSGNGTILDDDAVLDISDAIEVSDEAGTSAVFEVTLSAASSLTVTVDYASTGGSASSGSDFTAVSGTLTFSPGETYKTIEVPVTGDAEPEGVENFSVTLSNAQSAHVGDGEATGTISDLPAISIGDASIAEGDSGTSQMLFTVTLSNVSVATVTVDYSTFDSSATAGADYTAVSGTLTFGPGETEKTLSVDIVGDTDFESNETFFLELVAPTNATLGDFAGIGTIQNDDTLGGDTLIGTGGPDTLIGGTADDVVHALGGNDLVFGGNGNDTLDGGAGSDTLIGGIGSNQFVFDHAPNGLEVDLVIDFLPVGDTIALDDAVFSGVGVPGAFIPGSFNSGPGLSFGIQPDDRIIYNIATGGLYYDADGAGGAPGVLFATLQLSGGPAPVVSANDFVVI